MDRFKKLFKPKLSHRIQRITPGARWEDLVAPDSLIETLHEIAAQVRHLTNVKDDRGISQHHSHGVTSLFSGPSGTGKTLAAKVLATELRLDLYRVDLSAVVSKYIGETEKNLKAVFDAAEAAGAVLFFDEADALFGKRSEVKDSHDRYANVEANYLLQLMEVYRGLVILATNLHNEIDPAFRRRLRFIVEFPFPKAKDRERIWERAFRQDTPTQNLDMSKLAQLNVTGGSINTIALNAAFLAENAGEPVRMVHVAKAAKTEYENLGETLTEDEIRGWLPVEKSE